MSLPLLRITELRAFETAHLYDQPSLMERAGHAAAVIAMRILGSRRAPVLIFAGPGNNGGDAFVLARVLHEKKVPVQVVFLGDVSDLPADAQQAYARWRITSAGFSTAVPAGNYGLVVDGLFGIGLTRPMTGDYAALIERINQFAGPVLALDIPSGLDADTGRVISSDHEPGCAVRATHTISFIAGKPGLFTLDGPDHCGQISIDALGLANAITAPGGLLAIDDFCEYLQPRQRNTHKGRFGSLAVIGGAHSMSGAALLAGRAALHLGAGRVFVGLLETLPVDPVQPELMLRTAMDALAQATTAVIGPGLGVSNAALEILHRIASAEFSLLIDADALNLLALHPVLARQIAKRTTSTVLTPHPAEAARLLAASVESVQSDRVTAALEIAHRFNACVALKGCGTVIAHPDGRWRINPTGNAGLASGGTGDVLSGMVGALLAQGWSAQSALSCGVYLHGAAADALVQAGQGPIGLTAGELIPEARRLFNEWIATDV